MRKIGRWEDGKMGKEDGRMGEWEKRSPGILLSSYPLILLLVTIFNFSTTLVSAQVTVDARLDSARILIGDQVRLTIQVQSSGGALVQAPDLSVFDSLKNIEILDTSGIDTIQRGSTVTIEQHLTITSFDSGFYWLPKIPVNFVFNGKTGIVQSNSLRLEVATIPIASDSIQIAPIKPIIEEPRTLEDLAPFLIPLLILIIIGCIIYLFLKRKKKPKVQPPTRVLLPHEIALQKLMELQQQKLWQRGEVKQYQTELTFIIREYLEARFRIPALESTTDEIVTNLKATDLEESWRDRLQEIFINADLVKFAKAQPPMTIHEQGINESIHFVWETKPFVENIASDNKSSLNSNTDGLKPISLEEYLVQIKEKPLIFDKGPIQKQETVPASFGWRFLATCVDAVVVAPVCFLIAYVRYRTANEASFDEFILVYIVSAIYIFLFGWMYFAIFECIKQATPGKMLFKLKVTDLEGKPISFWRATGRYFARAISGAIFYIGFFMVLFNRRRQALHDMIAQTLVVREK